jgi:hypothetical protein
MALPKPISKILKGGDPAKEENWLECIPWLGYEKQFPDGVILPPGLRDVTSLIKSVMVLDAESDEGFKILKKKEVTADMEILNVQLNENSIAMIVGPDGLNSKTILIIDPDGGKQYTRQEWWDKHGHSDGLGMIAGNRFRRRVQGAGAHIGGL